MDESTGILPGFPAMAGKPVHIAFDGGRMTSETGIVLLAARAAAQDRPNALPLPCKTRPRAGGSCMGFPR